MRKFITIAVLTVSALVASGAANAYVGPQCGDHCPFVR